MTDEQLIKGFLTGSQREYSRVMGWVTDIVRSRLWTNRVDPEDVIADTRMKLLLSFRHGLFRAESSLKTHVQRITLYTLVDATRRVHAVHPSHVLQDLPDSSNPYSSLVQDEEAELFQRAYSLLPPGCQELIGMVLHDQLRYKEIAVRVGTTEGAIKTRLFRCRDRLKQLLEGMS